MRVLVTLVLASSFAAAADPGLELFEAKIRPALVEHCYACHSAEAAKANKLRGSLLLDTKAGWAAGGDTGPSIVPGKPKESLLIQSLKYEGDVHMPPKGKLPAAVIADFEKWVSLGAPDPRDGKAAPAGRVIDIEEGKKYWAFQPLQKTRVPSTEYPAKNEIDAFLASKWEAAGIAPAKEVEPRAWLRRVYFDLIGLPPTPEQVAAFEQSAIRDPQSAMEKVVDDLLKSPHYGERWARHWLDPARYAESHGFEHDYHRPNAYHYRDFLIKAFNANMPYKQFVEWQIAGDELAPDDREALAATGFLGAGVYPTQITTREAERVRYDAMDDMLATTGHAMLGLTVACARCHDHKYDPIPTKDYYRMLSAFTTTVRSEVEFIDGPDDEKAKVPGFEAKKAKLADELKKIKDKTSPEAKAKQAEIAAHEKTAPQVKRIKIQATTEGLQPMRHHTAEGSIPDFYKETYLLRRGDTAAKDGVMQLGFLQVAARAPDSKWMVGKSPNPRTSGRRTSLAHWITDTENGAGALAARVMVNRMWHHHFGRGIVSTLNDFGKQGEPPTHPELLEWLANDFVQSGWDVKRMHKKMVLSKAYALGSIEYRVRSTESKAVPVGETKKDPDNKLFWRRDKHRLEAEAIRDNLLAVGGVLDTTMYGPGTLNQAMTRRSIYFQVQRSQLIPMLQVFDWPDTLTSAGARSTTVVAPQALVFMNNANVKAWASGFAKRLQPAFDKSPADAVDLAYRTAFARPPSQDELKLGVDYLKAGTLAEYALALMSLNEFIYVE
jgi:cytochrome c553